MKNASKTAISAAIVLIASAAVAAPPPADKCEAAKNKVAGAYYACRQKAAASAITKEEMPDFGKCISKFTEKWNAAEAAGETMCPDDILLTADVEAYIAGQATEAAGLIAGSDIPECGDGAINASGEHCDGSALDGYSCASFGLHGTLACSAGCDFDLSGCTTCPASTVEYAGACWVLGTVEDAVAPAGEGSCEAACSALGLVYDDATSFIAGSDGSDANCVVVLDLLGVPGGALDNPSGDCPTGVGCGVIPAFDNRGRCATPATDSASYYVNISRACACE